MGPGGRKHGAFRAPTNVVGRKPPARGSPRRHSHTQTPPKRDPSKITTHVRTLCADRGEGRHRGAACAARSRGFPAALQHRADPADPAGDRRSAPRIPVPTCPTAARCWCAGGSSPAGSRILRELPPLFNARADTAAEKASFKAAMRHRRALIPASGFYEWRRDGSSRPQPYWVRPRHGGRSPLPG